MTVTNVRHLYWAGLNKPAVDALLSIDKTANSKIKTYVQTSAPTESDLVSGDLWIDSDDDNHPYRYDGSNWVSMRDGTIATAQTSANNAGAYIQSEPGTHSWTSDSSGVFTAGNPTRDLTLTLYDNSGTQIAQRVLRGTLTSAAGTVAVTNVSSSGLSSSYSLVDDGTSAPNAFVTFTFADGSEVVGSLAWIAIDTTTASSTPGSGGSK